ncbi:hypothetical protein RRG08_056757 [Elysia crispata]|uniref:Uncharacterized protein n=1 Tax=Elysia crispata TaxID=231223 RepID=A0AAE1DKH8_9GAST|nr:hypothetical protein RRG08_056757 [Elysia crispata]
MSFCKGTVCKMTPTPTTPNGDISARNSSYGLHTAGGGFLWQRTRVGTHSSRPNADPNNNSDQRSHLRLDHELSASVYLLMPEKLQALAANLSILAQIILIPPLEDDCVGEVTITV